MSSSVKRDKVGKLKSYAAYEIPEYWILDPVSGILEQYYLSAGKYELNDVYAKEEVIRSKFLPCVSLTMNDVMSTEA